MGKKLRTSPGGPPLHSGNSQGAWIERHAIIVFAALLALATLRIIATYPVFNHTVDEPAHLACGVQWYDQGAYTREMAHPPLARIAMAFGPFVTGSHSLNVPDMYQEGAAILFGSGHYERTLALARLGVLPFFWISCIVLFGAVRARLGALVALLALFLYSFTPPVLAHAGLATNDMALTAMLAASFVTGLMWLGQPTVRRSVLFGAATGLGVIAKFSFFVFLPAVAIAPLVCFLAAARHAPGGLSAFVGQRIKPLLIAVIVALVVIWSGYRFSFGPVAFAGISLPFPELFNGIAEVMKHNADGHAAYLLGQRSQFGWWYYYPVVLTVKTPLPLIALFFVGLAVSLKKGNRQAAPYWLPLAFSFSILLVSLSSRINIGVRHVLPVYLGFSVTAAIGAVWLYERAAERRWAPWLAGALLVWHGATSLLSHPDYIPYTNLIAGNRPEKVLVDSDLDWGQDMLRLSERLRELGVRQIAFNPLIAGDLQGGLGFPQITLMQPTRPSPGWNAASLTVMLSQRLGLGNQFPNAKLWTQGVAPTERIGKSTYLWYIADPAALHNRP